jgi:hypothetical protein
MPFRRHDVHRTFTSNKALANEMRFRHQPSEVLSTKIFNIIDRLYYCCIWHTMCLLITTRSNITPKGESIMKNVLSTIVAALVAVSFAGIVCAAEPAAPAMPAGHPPVAAEKAPAKPAKKAKKAKKAPKKEEAKPADAAAPAAPATPAAPAKK